MDLPSAFRYFKLAVKSIPDKIGFCALGDNTEQTAEEKSSKLDDRFENNGGSPVNQTIDEQMQRPLAPRPSSAKFEGDHPCTSRHFSRCNACVPERRPRAGEISSFCHLRSIKTILDPRLEACVWQQQGVSLGFFDFSLILKYSLLEALQSQVSAAGAQTSVEPTPCQPVSQSL